MLLLAVLVALVLIGLRLWATAALAQILSPTYYALIIHAIGVLIALAVALVADRLIRSVYWNGRFRKRRGREAPALVRDLVTVLLFSVAISAWLYLEFGVAATGLIAASSATAIVVGIALQSMILDFFSGLSINIDRSFDIGDWLTVHSMEFENSVYGKVEGMTWRTTMLRLEDGRCAMIPNRLITSNPVTNHTRPQGPKRLTVEVGTDLRVPTEQTMRLLLGEAYKALHANGLSAQPAPSVVVGRLDQDAVYYRVRFYADPNEITPNDAESIMLQTLKKAIQAHRIPTPFHQVEIRREESSPDRELTDVRDALSRVALFADVLSNEQLEKLVEEFAPNELASGTKLISQGDVGSSMFVILDGAASVTVTTGASTQEISVLASGDIVGEMSLMTGAPRTATVTALTSLRVLEITKEPIEALLASSPELLDGFGRVLAERQTKLSEVAARNTSVATVERDLLARMRVFFSRAFHHSQKRLS